MMVLKLVYNRRKQLLLFFCMVLCIHMIKFTNYYPNWDSMYGMKLNTVSMTHMGRWFAGSSAIFLHSKYDLQWVEGVVCSFFICLSMIMMLDLFCVSSKTYNYIAAFLFFAFPSVTDTFTYTLWSASYMLSLFLAVTGVYLCIRGGRIKHVLVSMILFALSLGIYQIYYAVSIVILCYYIASRLLNCNIEIKNEIKTYANCFICFFFGAVLYWVMAKIVLRVTGINLGDYQGISSAGIMSLSDYAHAAKNSLVRFVRFFFNGYNIYSNKCSNLHCRDVFGCENDII